MIRSGSGLIKTETEPLEMHACFLIGAYWKSQSNRTEPVEMYVCFDSNRKSGSPWFCSVSQLVFFFFFWVGLRAPRSTWYWEHEIGFAFIPFVPRWRSHNFWFFLFLKAPNSKSRNSSTPITFGNRLTVELRHTARATAAAAAATNNGGPSISATHKPEKLYAMTAPPLGCPLHKTSACCRWWSFLLRSGRDASRSGCSMGHGGSCSWVNPHCYLASFARRCFQGWLLHVVHTLSQSHYKQKLFLLNFISRSHNK